MKTCTGFRTLVFGLVLLGCASASGEEGSAGTGAPADSLAAPPPAQYFLRPPAAGGLGPRLGYPKFMQRPVLSENFGGVLGDSWARAGGSRVFEGRERSLEDFSSIDIPIKFPQTIGRVIGQGANLSVSGSEQITFGGQTRYQVNAPLTEYRQPSKFPQLNMKQHLRIDLKGTVGEKINVLVHHDSDVDTPLENRIKLNYDGDDDEIVQAVEMGNTNLAIPGSQFIGYSEQHQGLFGAKVLAKLGAMDMTVIASKQEGRTAGANIVGGAQRDSIRLLDMDFVRNKYFFSIDPEERTPSGRRKFLAGEMTAIEVYLDDGNGNNNVGEGVVEAYALLDPAQPPGETAWADSTYHGFFDVLERNRDYAVDQRTGEISLLKPLDAAHTLAVSYTYAYLDQGEQHTEVVGGKDNQDRLILKIIRPAEKYLIEQELIWGGTLKFERKNVYSFGANYVSEEKVKVRIFRKDPSGDISKATRQNQYEYSKILGVDLEDQNNNQAGPANNWQTDGYADGGTINGELGLLLFPDLKPFDPDIGGFAVSRPETLSQRNGKIYDVHPRKLKPEDSQYYMIVIFSTPQTIFKLPNINILDGSESVTLNGRRLTRNVDYDIYYDVGQIRFKTDEASSPDAKITVDYQYVPFFALAQQSLLGMQGTYKFSDKSSMGMAWIYQSKKSPDERPRLGQEPSQTMVADLNTRLEFEPDWLTAMTDALPIVKAQSPSRFSVAAEVAASFPNPNTKSDVYIEDMEGVRDLRAFSLNREAWVPATPPPSSPASYLWEDQRKIWWYVKDSEVKEQDLFPQAESRPGESFLPVLEINFRDFAYGQVPHSPDPAKQWAGLERLVSKTGSDFSDLRFLEVWLRAKQGSGGKMYVDLGAVSENFYHPWADSLNSEDKDADGKLSDTEDTGLDGKSDGSPGDDAGAYEDNYSFTENQREQGDYSGINGTEQNRLLDTEDLDANGNLDRDETFFRLGFDLNDTTYIVTRVGDWVHYRIPLADADTLGGSPSWRSIRFVRFFFAGVDSPSVFQIAYLQISGASWLEEGIRTKVDMARAQPPPNEIFEISAKNTRDDPDYVPPYDPGKDPEGFKKREQSLVFLMRNLGAGHSGSVFKSIPGASNDYTLYHTLAFYVHGDQYTSSEDLFLFVRFGADSLNFYEYGTKVRAGWQAIRVKLDDLTNLKIDRDTTRVPLYGKEVLFATQATPEGWVSVYGEPSIRRISRIGAGVLNGGSGPTTSTGLEVWFDDLRLTDVRREMGTARRVSIGAAFSDVMSVNADLKQTDTEFQNLGGTRRGSDDTDLTLSASATLDRFLPFPGMSIPFTAGYHKASSLPTLKSQSDIALTTREERKQELESWRDDNYSIGLARKSRSNNILGKLFIDSFSGRASYARSRHLSPVRADTSVTYSGSLAYSFKPWWNHALRIFRDYAISYLPEGVDLSLNGSTRNSRQIDRTQHNLVTLNVDRQIRGDIGVAFKPITGGAIQTDYSLKTTRDLDQNKNVPIMSSIGRGVELKRNQRAGVTVTPSLGRLLKPSLSYDVNYDEDAEPSVRSAGDPAAVRKASTSSHSGIDLRIQPSVYSGGAGSPADTSGVPLYRHVLTLVPDIDVRYSIDHSSKYNKLLGRPGLRFQLGIDPKVDKSLIYTGKTATSISGAGQPTDEVRQTNGLDVSTEFQPMEALSVTAKYKDTKDVRSYAGATTFDKEKVWPDLTGSMSTSTGLSVFKGAIKSSSFSAGYRGKVSSSGEGSSDTRRAKGSEWLPLVGWDATWSNGLRTTFNFRRTTSITEEVKGTGSEKKFTTNSATFSLKHTLSAPEGLYIPLAGHSLKFKSSLTLSVDVNYDSRVDTNLSASNRVDASTSTWTVSPKASYSFSKNVTGSADGRFDQSTDRKRNVTYRTIGLDVSVTIHF